MSAVRGPRPGHATPAAVLPSVETAARWLRRSHLPPVPVRVPRIGAEYELLAFDSSNRLPAQWQQGQGPLARWLRAHARARNWRPDASAKGVPRWLLPHGGVLTLEPGGQVEYATPPFTHPTRLTDDLRAVIEPLYPSAMRYGIELQACGIDPYNPLAAAPLQFESPRYTRMAAHFARRGDAGARMMRQTASLQINLDARSATDLTWRTANALVPYLVALFANSAWYAGHDTGAASYRARVWRELDPDRTGLMPGCEDPAREYARFALAAPALLLDGEPFGARPRRPADWPDHLSTLFPEVRPRGYLEIRSIDAVDLERAGRALRMVAGLLWHPEALACVAAVIGVPDPQLLERAGEQGLKDETLRLRAERLRDLGESAAAELSDAKSVARGPLRR